MLIAVEMFTSISPRLDEGLVAWSMQRPLIPPVFAHDALLSVHQNPYPDIGMALAIPMPDLEKRLHPRSRRVWLLAVSTDGRFMAKLSVRFYSNCAEDLEYFWRHAASLLASARKQPLPVPTHWVLENPIDCMESLTDLKSWGFGRDSSIDQIMTSMLRRSLEMDAGVAHWDQSVREREVQEHLSNQFSEVVITFLKVALDQDLVSLLLARPNMSFHTLYTLMSFAMQKNDNGRRYMERAILSESQALLDLAAREGGIPVRETILDGSSMPTLLMHDFDVSRGIHRRTLVHTISPKHSYRTNPVLADLPVSGDTFLASLPILRLLSYQRWPRTHERWSKFFEVAAELHALEIDDVSRSRLLLWLMNLNTQSPSYVFYMLLDYCNALCVAAKTLAGTNLELWEASLIAIDYMEKNHYQCPEEILESEEIGPTLIIVSTISGVDLDTLSYDLFEKTPLVPSEFESNYSIRPLRSTTMCKEHGVAVNQCIQNPETALFYASGGCALYGVYHLSGTPLGTIGCAYNDSDKNSPDIRVWEFSGVSNETSDDLESLSAALAERFSRSPEQLAKFAAYSDAVTSFRIRAGAQE